MMTRSKPATARRLLQFAGLLAVSGLVALGFVSAMASHRTSSAPALAPGTPPSLSGQPIEPPLALPNATLQDTAGQLFTLDSGAPPLLLLYFGNSRCFDACSETLAALAKAQDLLSPAQRTQVRVIIVTTEPEHDTPAVIRQWLDNFDPAFIGLTGYRVVIDELRAALRIDTGAAAPPANVLLFENGTAHRDYPPTTTTETYAHDLSTLLSTLP
jgi:protein SCO1